MSDSEHAVYANGHRLLVNETDEPNHPRVMATCHPASLESVKHVLSQPEEGSEGMDGRSPFQWIRFPNGDLVLATFPHGDTYFDVEVDADYLGPLGFVTAHFAPQAWINDEAVEVDSEGEQDWNATDHFWSEDMKPAYRMELTAEMNDPRHLAATDSDDWFKSDPSAPEWVRNWHGPFTITLEWSPLPHG